MPSYNIKTDYGAVGDGQMVTAVITASAASHTVSATTAVWTAGDNGKAIIIEGIGNPTAPNNAALQTFITSVAGDGKSITITAAVITAVSGSSQTITFGTNDRDAFLAFKAANQGVADVVLTIPSGIYLIEGTGGDTVRIFRGIPNPTIIGTGSPLLAGTFRLGAHLVPQQSTTFPVSSRIASVRAGSSTVQLLTPSEYTRFAPGRTFTASDGTVTTTGTSGMVTAIDTQGFGYPPNPGIWEYVTIASSVNTGVVTLSAPLRQSYSQNYPVYVGPGAFNLDLGGPATLYIFDASWDADIAITGVRFYTPDALCSMSARKVTLTNCAWLNVYGPDPSFNETWIADACDFSVCFTEIDKIVQNLIVRNGTTWRVMEFQGGGSIENLYIDASTITQQLKGTAKHNWFTNSSIAILQMGPTAYGICESIYCSGCTVGSVNGNLGVRDSDITNAAGANRYTLSNGVMTMDAGANAGSPVRWGMPGALMHLGGQHFSSGIFRVNLPNSVNSSVDTSMAGLSAYPTIPLSGGTILIVSAAPYLVGVFENNTGCDDIVDVSQPLARGKRYGEYSKRTFTQATIDNVRGNYSVGKLTKIVVDVSVAFTTAGTLTLNLFGQFKAVGVDPGGSTSGTLWSPHVDLKRAGTRTLIVGSGWTGTGGNDSMTDPGALWMGGAQAAFRSASITPGDPGVLTIEVFTDQGFQRRVASLALHA